MTQVTKLYILVQIYMDNNIFIGIAGNIGVGKTTFTNILGDHFQFSKYFESVSDNPYLSDFYKDMDRWSFNLQIYFLHHRFASHLDMMRSPQNVIQDRTIYEDVEIFATNLFDSRFMSERDWQTYHNLFKNMEQFLKKPSLIIYLKASVDTLLSRIKNRQRSFENDISSEYLFKLNLLYDSWINKLDKKDVLIIETDQFNVFQDHEQLNQIFSSIQKKLSI